MNVQITDINETRKALTVTLDMGEVQGEYTSLIGEYTKQVSLPGFRPGKAPAAMVAARFGKEIKDEFKNRVIGKAYRDGLEQSKLEVLSLVDVEEGTIEPNLSAAIKLTVDVRPTIKLPEYTGIETKIEATEPTEAEIDGVIEGLRAERADFKVAERPAAKGDYVRFGYTGTLDGKPLDEVVGDKKIYAAAPQTWEEVEGANEGLLPGVSSQLSGLKTGDKKNVDVTFPADFAAVPALAGKTVAYAIEVQEIRERILAPLDEAFYKSHQVDDLDGLKAQIKANLTARKDYANRAAQRRQITETLATRADFPVPESLVNSERDGILRQFIEENLRNGVPQEKLEENKKELYENAGKAAATRVKVQLILAEIAQAEKLKVDEKDFNNWLMREAMRSGQQPQKLAKDLGKDRDQVRAIQQQLLFDKALDFLVTKATVITVTNKA
ncbi:Trigger factor [Lacunisphaera limnophila]|uniref:Trigger factor n=1 Tax=Lacunisphaera limnophila TaxID=1838286 RepID=A0A1D8AWX9_9BACT|nr:trigger factor [Lacunisphaera limnophila]AOS45400.1 Trigger factor [Lacunisphaera limnophila]